MIHRKLSPSRPANAIVHFRATFIRRRRLVESREQGFRNAGVAPH